MQQLDTIQISYNQQEKTGTLNVHSTLENELNMLMILITDIIKGLSETQYSKEEAIHMIYLAVSTATNNYVDKDNYEQDEKDKCTSCIDLEKCINEESE